MDKNFGFICSPNRQNPNFLKLLSLLLTLGIWIQRRHGKPPGRLTRVLRKLVNKPPTSPSCHLVALWDDLDSFDWDYIPFQLPLGFRDLEAYLASYLDSKVDSYPPLGQHIAADMIRFFIREYDVVGGGGYIRREFNVGAELELIIETREWVIPRAASPLFRVTTCAICLKNFPLPRDDDMALTPCGHIFHVTCLERSLTEASVNCPICRGRVLRLGLCTS